MSYNIERGFHSREHILEENRLFAAKRAVQQVRPDILALTEACYGGLNSHGILMDYQEIFGFSYIYFAGYSNFGPMRGDEGGNCILSQFPMQAEAIPLAYKGAVQAKVNIEGKVLTIHLVHPSHSVSDEEKISTLRPLISSRQEPYILTGDFNTVHPEDVYDWELLAKELAAFNPEKAESLIDNWRRAGLVSWFLELGLKDSFSSDARESTVPTKYVYSEGAKDSNKEKRLHYPAEAIQMFDNKSPQLYQEQRAGVRMDFFFVSPDVKSIESYVLKDQDTEIASDHYPIVGVFEIK